jgi:hypothetical protein
VKTLGGRGHLEQTDMARIDEQARSVIRFMAELSIRLFEMAASAPRP